MFQLFSIEHFSYLLIYFLSFSFIFLLIFSTENKKFFYFFIFFIIELQISEFFYRWYFLNENIRTLLPLQFCNIALLISCLAIFTRSKLLFTISYLWNFGAFFSLLMPEVRLLFPNLLHLSFFSTHFFLILTSCYGLFILDIRPTFSTVITSFILINLIGFGIFFLNSKLNTNYMYINYSPSLNSPLKFFGNWRHFILIVDGILLILSFIFYKIFRLNIRIKLYR